MKVMLNLIITLAFLTNASVFLLFGAAMLSIGWDAGQRHPNNDFCNHFPICLTK